MANIIKIKRGLKVNLPTLEIGEQAYCTDTNELFIGTSTGNVLLNEDTDISSLDNIDDVEFTDLQAGDTLVYDGTNWVNQALPLEFGVQWNQPIDTVTRLGDAIGLTAGSDFTTLGDKGVWKLRRCMVNDDKSINYYIDPSDPTKIGEVVNTSFTSGNNADYTGGDGQVMVEIPKFYWKTVEPSSNVYQWWVSPIEFDSSYEVHPAFITEGQTREFIYMSAFEADVFDNKLRSISGVVPVNEIIGSNALNQLRNQAQARGTGWQIQTYFGTHALQILYLIEYADFDSQTTIGRGFVEKNEFNFDLGGREKPTTTGRTIFLGNESGREAGTDGLTAISYRGVENFWGNVFTFVDGLLVDNNGPEFFTANENFSSTPNSMPSNWTSQGTNTISQGVDGFPTNILFPNFLAKTLGGSSTSHLYDAYVAFSPLGDFCAAKVGGGLWTDFYAPGSSGAFYLSFLYPLDDFGFGFNPEPEDGVRLQIL